MTAGGYSCEFRHLPDGTTCLQIDNRQQVNLPLRVCEIRSTMQSIGAPPRAVMEVEPPPVGVPVAEFVGACSILAHFTGFAVRPNAVFRPMGDDLAAYPDDVL